MYVAVNTNLIPSVIHLPTPGAREERPWHMQAGCMSPESGRGGLEKIQLYWTFWSARCVATKINHEQYDIVQQCPALKLCKCQRKLSIVWLSVECQSRHWLSVGWVLIEMSIKCWLRCQTDQHSIADVFSTRVLWLRYYAWKHGLPLGTKLGDHWWEVTWL